MDGKKRDISSAQLMHFVGKEKYLIEILNHNFYPRLCCEDSIKPFFKSNVYVPMKCFCDIPLEYLEDHMITYGQYGVGFKKSWGEKVGLTPVIYYNEKSPYIQNMREIYNEMIKSLNNCHIDAKRLEIVENLRILKCSFTMYKPIYGKYKHGERCWDNYCFYDEHEWRYVLPASTTAYLQSDLLPQCLIDSYNGVVKEGLWESGQLELNNQINFTYDDIEFVIIPITCDKNNIIENLAVSHNDIEKIKNKITTFESLVAER